ncbi:MAG: hypothetical protein IJN17_08665 [Clostridia bacterium]|nr:hypothetical protein [Clostridia bacterium]
MKTKIRIIDSVVAVLIALAIIISGFILIKNSRTLFEKEKNKTVTVDVQKSHDETQKRKMISDAYPWTLIKDQAPLEEEVPAWITIKIRRLSESFTDSNQYDFSKAEYYTTRDIHLVKNVILSCGTSYNELIMNFACDSDGNLISFIIEPLTRNTYKTATVNECFKTICDSAEYHRLNGSNTDLSNYLQILLSGVFYEREETPLSGGAYISDSILYVDPIADFFYSYCRWQFYSADRRDVFDIIAIINNQIPTAFYSDGKIILDFNSSALGTMMLCWDMETCRFSGMTFYK